MRLTCIINVRNSKLVHLSDRFIGKLYSDMLEIFDNDLFHMGGDEVNVKCWNDTEEITKYLKKKGKDLEHDTFIELWNEFQQKGT